MYLSEISNWFLVFARVGAFLAVLPMFALKGIPVKLRVIFGATIAVLLAPFLPLVPADTLPTWSLVRLLAAEVCIGLLLGFVCRLVFFALDMAGSIIATEMGLMMPNEMNPATQAQTGAPGMILYWMAVMMWFSLDLHHWMIAGMQRSYAIVPVGGAHLSAALFNDILHRSGLIFVMAIQVSAPTLGVSFILILALSMLGRAVPQMNVFAESFPIRTLVGLTIFGTTSTFMAQHMLNYLRRLPEDTLRVMQLLGTA